MRLLERWKRYWAHPDFEHLDESGWLKTRLLTEGGGLVVKCPRKPPGDYREIVLQGTDVVYDIWFFPGCLPGGTVIGKYRRLFRGSGSK